MAVRNRILTNATKKILVLPINSVELQVSMHVVILAIKTRNGGRFELSVLTVSFIYEPVFGQPLCYAIESHPHLSRLDLVDPPSDGGKLTIIVLIAFDHY